MGAGVMTNPARRCPKLDDVKDDTQRLGHDVVGQPK